MPSVQSSFHATEAPTEADQLAQETSRRFSNFLLPKRNKPFQLKVESDGERVEVTIRVPAFQRFMEILALMAKGNASR